MERERGLLLSTLKSTLRRTRLSTTQIGMACSAWELLMPESGALYSLEVRWMPKFGVNLEYCSANDLSRLRMVSSTLRAFIQTWETLNSPSTPCSPPTPATSDQASTDSSTKPSSTLVHPSTTMTSSRALVGDVVTAIFPNPSATDTTLTTSPVPGSSKTTMSESSLSPAVGAS